MNLKKMNKIKLFYVVSFFGINILSCFLLTTNIFIDNLSPYPRDLFMLTNSFFGDLGFLLVFLSIAIIVFKTDYARSRFLMIVSIVFSIFFIALTIYFGYYGMFFSFYNLAAFSSEGGGDAFMFLVESLLTLIAEAKLFFLISALIMIVLYVMFFRKNRKNETFKKSSIVVGINRFFIGFGLLIVGILIMTSSLSAYRVEIDDTWFEDNTTPLHGAQTLGLFNYYAYDAYSYIFTDKQGYSEEKINEIRNKLEALKSSKQTSPIDNIQYDNNSLYSGIYKNKNLLLIQSESLSNYVIGLKANINGEVIEITPNLNRLVGRSVYFNNFYTSVGIGNTSDAEFTNLTGLNPIGSNYTVYEFADADYQTLPKLFRQEGYGAFSAHANTGKFYERSTLHPSLYGFEKHYAEEDLIIEPGDLIHTWLNDIDFLHQAIDLMKVKSENGPVFSFAITVSSHMPYKQPTDNGENDNWFPNKENILPKDFKFVNQSTLNSEILGYLEHANYADYALGEALKYLEQTGLAKDTIVILYGDHGSGIDAYEAFYQNPGMFTNDINPIITYNENEYERKLIERKFLTNVPFIIYDPTYVDGSESHILKPQKISLVRGSNSTVRTIANLFGLNPTYYFGVDALSDAKTFAYNPRNLDIIADGIVISGQSRNYVITDESYREFYNIPKVQAIVDEFLKFKDFNDKILKYKIFGLK